MALALARGMGSERQISRLPVEFSPAAWTQIGTMRWEVFGEIRNILTCLSAEPVHQDGSAFTVGVGEWVMECRFDPRRQAVVVVDLRLSGSR